MRRRARGCAVLAAAAWLCVSASRADEEAAAPEPASAAPSAPADSSAPAEPAPPSSPAVDGRALASLTRMLDALVAAQALHVVAEDEYDVVRESGETLSFSRVSDVTVRRPDRLRIETSEAGGARRVLGYDGRFVTLYDARESWFAAAPREADLDAVLAFVRDEIGVDLPLAPLFSTRVGELLAGDLTSAVFVGRETHEGEPYDHLALRYGDVGLQLWIASTGEPLPRRLTLSFEGALGRPQLHADFRAWDLEPDVSERVFAFDPPKGVRAIPFALPKGSAAAGAPARAGARLAESGTGGPAVGGLVSLERARRPGHGAEAEADAYDTAARLEQAIRRPRSERPVARGRKASSRDAPDSHPLVESETTPVARWDVPAADGGLHVIDVGDIDWGTAEWLGLAIGTALRPRAFEHMTQQPGCNVSRTEVSGRRYARCHGTWWVEAIARGELTYVAVEPPPERRVEPVPEPQAEPLPEAQSD